jgi:lipopolysaccharide/colanic/teichoic acid biosynthesis glycosyltransferase
MRTAFPVLEYFPSLTLKRCMDILIASCGLVLLSPLFLILAIGIRINSSGPTFFRQLRIGKGGQKFWMFKFRTMQDCSEEQLAGFLTTDPSIRLTYLERQKLVDDPRITRFGQLLRKTSLDEIPQLWNVLIGDMSLVGPRPFLPEQRGFYGSLYSQYILFQPGITGLWQVSGRNKLSFKDRVELDRYYFEHWSIGLDAVILARSLKAVLTGEGAY